MYSKYTIQNIFTSISLIFLCYNSLRAQQDSTFVLCGEGLRNPYYHPTLQHYGEFKAIKQYYYNFYDGEKYKAIEHNNGIVRIQFVINCKGETGQYTVENCDHNFKPTFINNKIVDELLFLTQQLNGWIPAKDEKGEAINSHKFFAFKIRNGSIIDILPK
jgi:hypothetical protein